MSNKENFEINNDITFTGKKDLEDLIAEYKELKKLLGTNDKEVNNLYKDFEGMAAIVDEINKSLKATPSDAFKEADNNLKAAQHSAEKATKKLKYWNNELDKPNNAPRRIEEINSKIEGFQHDLEKANTEAKKFGGKKGWLVQQHKDVDISGPVKEYEERVAQLLPKLDTVVLKLTDIKDASIEAENSFEGFQEVGESIEIINDKVYESANRLRELKQQLKTAVPGTQEWKDLTQQIALEKQVVDEYTQEVNEETIAILKASKTQEEANADAEKAEQAYSELNPLLESYRDTVTSLAEDYGRFSQEYEDNTEIINNPEAFVRASDNITDFKDKIGETLDAVQALSDKGDEEIPLMFRSEFIAQVNELAEQTSELFNNINDLEAPITKIGNMSEAQIENLVGYLADLIDAEREALSAEGLNEEEINESLKSTIKLATDVGKVWEEINKDVNATASSKESAGKQEAVAEEEVNDLDRYADSLLRVNARLKQLSAEQRGLEKKVIIGTDAPEDSEIYERNREEIAHLKEVKEELNATTNDTCQNIKVEEAAFARYSDGLLGIIQQLKDLKAEKYELERTPVDELPPDAGARYAEVVSEIARLTAEKKEYEAELRGVTKEENKSATSKKNLSKHTRRAANAHKDFNKALGNVKKSLKKGLTMITKYVLGFRSMFFLVRKLKEVVKEGLENLVQFDSGNNKTNKAITELQTSLLYLKNAWAAAVAPILNIVIPILNMLIDAFARVGNAIARFFGALTGESKVINAVKADVGDYAKSLEKSAGSSGKASKAADKLHDRLAAFDDLNVLGKDNETDPNSSGGGGGGGDNGMPNVDDMFKWVETEDFSDIATKIKDSIASGDFSGIGSLLSEKIRDGLNSIDWDSIRETLSSGISMITSFINGVFETDGLGESIGTSLGEALNTGIQAIHQFINEINWREISGNISSGISSFLSTLDFAEVFATITDGVKKSFEALSGFLENLDLKSVLDNIMTGITTFFSTYDWASFFKDFGRLLGDVAVLVATLVDWLSDGFCDMLINFEKYFGPYIEPYLEAFGDNPSWWEIGGAIIAGIFDGITDALANVLDWIIENILTPMVDGVCEAFEIHSPSKVFEEIGGYLIEGLYEGIKNVITIITTPFITLKAKLIGIFNLIKSNATTIWNSLKFKLQTIVLAIKGIITTPFENIKEKVIEITSSLKESVVQLWNGIWTGIKGVINKILGGIESFCNGIIDAINDLLDISSLIDKVPEKIRKELDLDTFTLPTLSHVSIPRLAQGAVIPPNKEFLALLGDQTSGTNIEAPLDTIIDAFRDVVGSMQIETGNQVLQVDGQTFARLMTPYVVSELGRRGYNVKILEG